MRACVRARARTCVCDVEMTIDNAFVCPCGAYRIARHNNVRDELVGAVSEIVKDVDIEPVILPYDGEDLPRRSMIRAQEARVDIRIRGFWLRQQDTFFDVQITHLRTSLLSQSEVLSNTRIIRV